MKLLIVDDQLATLSGLTNGINWKEIGITEVDTAQNAMEARLSYAKEIPDVMLCDIEMPVETGLELSAWVRAQNYETKIIFLTCHSDFNYAQEAISLGASDYIIQPAPYHRIREKVEKVLKEIRVKEKQVELENLGKVYAQQQSDISNSIWRGFLLGTVEDNVLDSLPDVPKLDSDIWLVLVQMVQQTEKIKEWNTNILTVALKNTVTDIFNADKYRKVLAFMENHSFALVIEPIEKGTMNRDQLISNLKYLENMYDMYMPCSLAYYVRGPLPMKDARSVWNELVTMRNQNVTGKKGLYTEQIDAKDGTYKQQFYRWKMILENNGVQAMEEDILTSLRKLSGEGKLNEKVLLAFHVDFTRLMMSVSGEMNNSLSEVFAEGKSKHYINAMTSQADMEQLIHEFAEYLSEVEKPEDGNAVVRTVIEYIDEHLSENIRKEDLTELMHLNEDYLTRIFKKEMGQSIKSYIIQKKMHAARELLQTTSLSVGSVAIQFGYTNFSHFAASYKKEFGITPAEEKEKAGV